MGEIAKLLTSIGGAAQGAVGSQGVQQSGAPIPQTPPLPPLPSAAGQLAAMPGPQPSPVTGVEVPGAISEQGGMMPMQSALFGQQLAMPPGQEEKPEPVDNRYTPLDDAPEGPEISVEGDAWQPKKQDILSQVGDWFTRGLFRERTKQANIKDAMEDFDEDPQRAIRRLRKVDPEKAQELWERSARVRANQELAEARDQEQKLKASGIASSMVGGILEMPNAEEAYSRLLPTLRRYAQHYGYDPSLFSDKFDRNELGLVASKGLSRYEQERLRDADITERRQADYQNRSLGALSDHRAEQRGEVSRHNQANEALSAERVEISRNSRRNQPDQTTVINTKYGKGLVSSNGKQMTIVRDGNRHRYIRVNDKWVPWEIVPVDEE